MGICNRDFDVSQQKQVYRGNVKSDVGQSLSPMVAVVNTPGTVVAARIAGQGLSGAPVGYLEVQRFNAGAGVTQWALGSTIGVLAYGTSGMLTYTLLAAGSTLLNVAMGDVLVYRAHPTANTAALEVAVEIVVKSLQDIVATFGSQT